MRTTQQLSVTLPNSMADMVKAKVQAGEYASESEVIRDGLRVLLAAQKIMSRQGGMKLVHVNETIREIFEITGFSDILTIE